MRKREKRRRGTKNNKHKETKKQRDNETTKKREENRRNVQTYQNDQSRDGVACQEEVPASAYCKRRRLDLGTQSHHSIHEP